MARRASALAVVVGGLVLIGAVLGSRIARYDAFVGPFLISLALVTAVFGLAAYRILTRSVDVFDVVLVLPAVLVLYTIMFLYIMVEDPGHHDPTRLMRFMWAMTAAVLGLIAGLCSPIRHVGARLLPRFRSLTRVDLRRAAFVLAAFGGILVGLLIMSAGGIGAYLSLSYAGAETLQFAEGRGHLAVGFSFLSVAGALLIAAASNWKQRLPGYLLLGSLLAVHFQLGRRFEILALALLILALHHYVVRPISIPKAAALFACLYAFAALYGLYRGDLALGVGTVAERATANFSAADLSASNIGEFTDVPDALWEVVGSDTEHLYGSTYGRGLSQFVPLAVWPDRPETLDRFRIRMFHPQFDQTAGSKAHFMVAEAFWNFGYLGAFAQMFAYGSIAGAFYVYMRRSGSRASVVLYVAALPLFVKGFRNDFMVTGKSLLLELLLPILVLLVLDLLARRRATV